MFVDISEKTKINCSDITTSTKDSLLLLLSKAIVSFRKKNYDNKVFVNNDFIIYGSFVRRLLQNVTDEKILFSSDVDVFLDSVEERNYVIKFLKSLGSISHFLRQTTRQNVYSMFTSSERIYLNINNTDVMIDLVVNCLNTNDSREFFHNNIDFTVNAFYMSVKLDFEIDLPLTTSYEILTRKLVETSLREALTSFKQTDKYEECLFYIEFTKLKSMFIDHIQNGILCCFNQDKGDVINFLEVSKHDTDKLFLTKSEGGNIINFLKKKNLDGNSAFFSTFCVSWIIRQFIKQYTEVYFLGRIVKMQDRGYKLIDMFTLPQYLRMSKMFDFETYKKLTTTGTVCSNCGKQTKNLTADEITNKDVCILCKSISVYSNFRTCNIEKYLALREKKGTLNVLFYSCDKCENCFYCKK